MHNGQFRYAVTYLCQVSGAVVKECVLLNKQENISLLHMWENLHSCQSPSGDGSSRYNVAASGNGIISRAWCPCSYCSTMNILLAIPLPPSTSRCLIPPAQTLAGFSSMWRCSRSLSHSSAHTRLQGRRSSWRFLTTQHSPPAQSPCSENGNWIALKAALFLEKSAFQFLGFRVQIPFDS